MNNEFASSRFPASPPRKCTQKCVYQTTPTKLGGTFDLNLTKQLHGISFGGKSLGILSD
jgi:hypothetical protein